MQNKRGQGLSTNAIILIVLGVIVLVVLIVGFTMGWERIAPWLSTTNVDIIVNQCGVACSTNSMYAYCSQKRDLKSDDGILEDVSCYYLSEKQTKYGIEKCSSISCDIILVDLSGEEILETKCEGNEGKTIQALINNKLENYDCAALSS